MRKSWSREVVYTHSKTEYGIMGCLPSFVQESAVGFDLPQTDFTWGVKRLLDEMDCVCMGRNKGTSSISLQPQSSPPTNFKRIPHGKQQIKKYKQEIEIEGVAK